MPLSLTCSCGVRFEVEETFAGQEVTCPECQRPLRAPVPHHLPRRTSWLALASMILAVVGSFTILGTVVAVLLGLLALVSVTRHRDRLAGTGYALFGIIWGVIFTGLACFAYTSGELFNLDNWFRDKMLAEQVSYEGPLEVVKPQHNFAITRPTEKWGVANDSPEPILWPDDPGRGVDITLVHAPTYTLVDVTFDAVEGMSLEQCQERVIGWFHNKTSGKKTEPENPFLRFTHTKLRHSQKLKPVERAEVAELLLDVRLAGEARTYLVRLFQRDRELYVVRGWTSKHRFEQMEPEIRKAMDSFRLLR